jgi:hypothetical protein
MEMTASKYKKELRIYGIRSPGQPAKYFSPTWGLSVGLTTPRCENATEHQKGHQIWKYFWVNDESQGK